MELPYGPAISLPGIYVEKRKMLIRKDTYTTMFIYFAAALYISQDMESTQVSINRPMDKEEVVSICTMEYYSAIKNNEILPFVARWMDLENIILSEISLREEDKYCMISLICGI